MSRIASTAVLVGGVIYPAGQPVPDKVAAMVTEDVWVEDVAEGDDETPTEPETPKRTRARTPRK